jgi:hypothetical protein
MHDQMIFDRNDEHKLVDARRFDDSQFCINPVLLFLMSRDHAIIQIEYSQDHEAYAIDLFTPNQSMNAPPGPTEYDSRFYAIAQVESEGCTLYIYERPAK